MSRYIQIIIIFFFFVGCSVKTPIVEVGKKSFEAEDLLIIQALDYQANRDFSKSIDTYKSLYTQSGKLNYLVEAAKMSFLTKKSQDTHLLIQKALKENPENINLRRILIALYNQDKKFALAIKEIDILLSLKKDSRNLTIAGVTHLRVKSYDIALKYFESAYKESLDENVLLHMVEILYNFLGHKKEAISYLETHTRMQTCSEVLCSKLIEIYGKEQNIDGIISTYKRMYNRFDDEEYARRVVELLMYKKDRKGAIDFLSSSGYNQEMLLDIYASHNDYTAAFQTAKKLYAKTNDIKYLGKMAIFEYESSNEKSNKKLLLSVTKKFEQVVSELEEALYLNYYGYLLIDHDINIEKGLKLVKRALVKEPNSIYYLDSLAWGFYKQNRCQAAKEILDKFIDRVKEDEVLMHYKKIKQCLGKK